MHFIAFHHFALCPIDASSERHFAAFIKHAYGADFGIFVQSFGQFDELFVLDDGIRVLLHTQHLPIVSPSDGLKAFNGSTSGIEDGGANHFPISLAKGEGFASRKGAIDNVAEAVPGGFAVEEGAGGELMSHGSEGG